MSDSNLPEELELALRPAARVMQIIIGALFLGASFFVGIVLFLRLGQPGPAGNAQQFLTPIALGFALLAIVGSAIVPNLIVRQMRHSIVRGTFRMPSGEGTPEKQRQILDSLGPAAPLCVVCQTKLIIGAAMLEGAAFFNAIAYLIEGNALALAAIAVLLVLLLSKFPTSARIAAWMVPQMRLIDEEKSLSR